jgi:glycosidase
MVWDPKKQDQEMLHFFQKLIALRQKYADVISKGDTDWRTVDDITGLVHLVRKYHGTHVHGVFNLGEKPVALRHTHKDEIALKQGLADKQLAPNGFLIYVKK